MRGAAILALALAACASAPPAPPPAASAPAVAIPPRAPEPPPPPPLPPPELADRIVEAQAKVEAPLVTATFNAVEDDVLSGDTTHAVAALQDMQEIALRAEQTRVERMRAAPGEMELLVVASDHLEPLLERIGRLLQQLMLQKDCTMVLAVAGAYGQLARVPRGRVSVIGRNLERGAPMPTRAVVCAMQAIKPKVEACYAQYQIPGTAMVNVVVSKQGSVVTAVTTGKFARTPTGDCVAAAVTTATFPPSDGLSTPYPFVLK